eukprot:3872892-Pleurochrysis_carterae.AAC.2
MTTLLAWTKCDADQIGEARRTQHQHRPVQHPDQKQHQHHHHLVRHSQEDNEMRCAADGKQVVR